MVILVRPGMMVQHTKEATRTVKNMEKVNLLGQIGVLTLETFMKTKFKAPEFVSGVMVGHTMGSGKTTRYRAMARSPILTVILTVGISLTTKSMAKA